MDERADDLDKLSRALNELLEDDVEAHSAEDSDGDIDDPNSTLWTGSCGSTT